MSKETEVTEQEIQDVQEQLRRVCEECPNITIVSEQIIPYSMITDDDLAFYKNIAKRK